MCSPWIGEFVFLEDKYYIVIIYLLVLLCIVHDLLSLKTISPLVSSVTQSCLTLRPRGLQHTRLPCLSPAPRACSNSCSSSQWYHPTISSSVIPFSSCLRSFPAWGSFPRSQFFASGGQSIGVSTSVLPVNIQYWFPLGWTVGSPCSPRDSQKSSPIPQFKSINSLVLSFLYGPTLTSIHDYLKNHSFTIWTFVGKVMFSAF